MFRDDPAAHEQHHQRRDKGDGQKGGRGHRKCLRVGERLEQAAFLRLQGENRQERDGDHEKAEEQRRADLARRLNQNFSPGFPVGGSFETLVCVLDHNYRSVDHGADRDCDTSKTHDVGSEPQEMHAEVGCEYA